MGYLLLRDNLLFRKHLHGVDTARVLFADLEDASESAAANELEEVKVGRFEMDLVLIDQFLPRLRVMRTDREVTVPSSSQARKGLAD